MKYLKSIVACFFMILATACCKRESEIEPIKPASTHTYLIYIMGDNSLSTFAANNIRLVKKGILNATEDINVVIYKDNKDHGDQLPTLFQLKKVIDEKTKQAKIDTIFIKKYETELNSSDPNVLKEIVKTTFTMFDTEVKGMEFWSHGLSWVPSDGYSATTKATRYIGQDDSDFLQLWDIRKALEDCPHLDYITFDACYCGFAEVANELDQVCDYIYAPITEIMGDGFPYHTMIPTLANCQKSSDVRKTMIALVEDFIANYTGKDYGYALTLLETKNADNLSKALAKLRNANKEACDELRKNPSLYEGQFMYYGRPSRRCRFLFYEFQDYITYLSQNPSEETKAILKEIAANDIILKYAATDYFQEGWEYLDISRSQGLGVTIPELMQLDMNNAERYTKCYGLCKWGKNLGY